MSANDGGPAFAAVEQVDVCAGNGARTKDVFHLGMTLRDYFAAKALAAMITTAAAPCMFGLEGAEGIVAKHAYRIADAMLTAREAHS